MKIRMRTVVGAAFAVAAPAALLFAAVPNTFAPNTVISSAQVNQNFVALDQRITALTTELAALKAPPVWTNADLLNSWTAYGGDWPGPAFTKDAQGFVHMRGLVKRAAAPANVSVLVLPVGFRPRVNLEAPVACGGAVPCEVIIRPTGETLFETGDIGWVSFDGLTFEAAPAP